MPTERMNSQDKANNDGSLSTSLQKNVPMKAAMKGKRAGDSAQTEGRQNPNVYGMNSSLKNFESQLADYVNSNSHSYANVPDSQDLKKSSEDF